MVRCQSDSFKARTLNFWKRTLNFWKANSLVLEWSWCAASHMLSKPGPSIFENGPSIFEKCRDPRKTANFGGKKLFLVSEKNFPVRKWVCHVLFAKKMEKFRQIWPQQPLKHFTAAYRGLPPCTQSQHPINRETGNSNVLWVRWASCNVYQF